MPFRAGKTEKKGSDPSGNRVTLPSPRPLRISLAVQKGHRPALSQSGVGVETALLLGGQIAGQPHAMFMIYPQGNGLCSSPETP